MQTNLPDDFVYLMHEHYDTATADVLLEALDSTMPDVSIRLNPRKLSGEEVMAHNQDLEPVPWCPNAFFMKGRPAFTFDPLLHAGAYYVQEAASMFVAELIDLKVSSWGGSPLLALDLCAAPGGKSTLLHSLLPEDSVLISNEPNHKRAQILSENMQKWTRGLPGNAPRSIVTQMYPSEFGTFTGQVDVLLADVPCSGEGMFRKDEGARREWSLENVRMCQQRQRDILLDIRHVLKPGGLLIYSTCTFNRYEDEENVRWICTELGGKLIAERHFLPGRDRGEGFYAAAIICGEHQAGGQSGRDFRLSINGLRVLYDSTSALSAPGSFSSPALNLSYDDALRYLRREALRVEAPLGPVTLCYRGLVLGEGKSVRGRINNLYPEAWRIRTTYTTPWSLLPPVPATNS